jgi:peptidoglycan/xylan/chitin deacetylase (PgdA/CDA1 family)
MILMYHHVCPPERIPAARVDLEGWQFNIAPDDFRAQLQYLQKRGFQFVSLTDYVNALHLPYRSRAKQMAITFDDGWRDNHEFALPILRSLGLTATFYIVTGAMQGVDAAKRMSLRDLQAIANAGMEIGGHSVTHPNLATLSLEHLQCELVDCKQKLQDDLGTEVRHFAYPGGRFNQLVVEQCERAGYQSAVCSIGWGKNDMSKRYSLHRETLDASPTTFRNLLRMNQAIRFLFAFRSHKRLRAMITSHSLQLY